MTARPPRLREKAEVLDASALDRALTRIAHEILEKNGGAKDVTFVGLRTRGVTLAQRLAAKIAAIDGATVETAEGGEAGLHAVERMRPDVVLCDIGLPDIDGFEVARRIRARADLAATRLIALTGYGQAEDMRQALKAGFEAHLTKPVNLEQLMALLTSVSR